MLSFFLSLLCEALGMDCSVTHTHRFPFFFSSWWSGRRSLPPVPVSVSTQTSPRAIIAPPSPPPSRLPPHPLPLPSPPAEPEPAMDPEIVGREAMEDLDGLVGLENVKRYLHGVQTWVQICRRHGRDPRGEWYNIALQGNPGTGKTTVARIYSRLLYAMGITDNLLIHETTGSELASTGLSSFLKPSETTSKDGIDLPRLPLSSPSCPPVLIIDHPYSIPPNHPVLDELMTHMEEQAPSNRTMVVFTGDTDDMDTWLRVQPRLRRLTCSSLRFADFDRDELLTLLARQISQAYQGRMQVEGGVEGAYMAVAARRLARTSRVRSSSSSPSSTSASASASASSSSPTSLGSSVSSSCSSLGTRKGPKCTNIYAVKEFIAGIARRQAEFLTEQRDSGMEEVDYFLFSKEDVLGPRPAQIRESSESWSSLQKMVGQDALRESVGELFETAEENYWREVQGQKRVAMRLNRVFAGPPGTGKRTAARLYAAVLKELGLVSGGVVSKHLSELGSNVGHGRVLLIRVDEVKEIPQTALDALTDRLLAPQEDSRCVVVVLHGTSAAIEDLFSRLHGRGKSTPLLVPFQGFTPDHMKQLVERKLLEQDVDATPEALQAALEILEHARLRKDFDHARAIDHLIVAAHRNFTARQTEPLGPETDRTLEAQDFSPELANVRSALAFRDELRHAVVPDDIISVLKRYHTELKAAWMTGQDPASRVPLAFVFKGACGTGKKTVARQLGALYYRMGVLSSELVVDCSVSDLLPTHGTREQLSRSRGQVLFISDAHRLSDSDTPARTLDDLIYLIPRSEDQTVVILAGPAPEMDQLLANKPRLSSLFQEEIVFRNPTPRECLRLLDRRLEEAGVMGVRGYLTDPRTPSHREFTRAIQILSMFPCWSNAQDVEVLVRWMVAATVRETPLEGGMLADMQLSEEQAMACLVKLYNLKRDRLRFNQDPKARTLPRVLSQPRLTDRTGVRFPV